MSNSRPKRKWYNINPFPHFWKSGNGFMLYHFRILENAEIKFPFFHSRQIHLFIISGFTIFCFIAAFDCISVDWIFPLIERHSTLMNLLHTACIVLYASHSVFDWKPSCCIFDTVLVFEYFKEISHKRFYWNFGFFISRALCKYLWPLNFWRNLMVYIVKFSHL